MAKKRKNNWFWKAQDDNKSGNLFQNTIKQHAEKIKNILTLKEPTDIVGYDEEEESPYYHHDDWSESWNDKNGKRKESKFSWDEYNKDKKWKGYNSYQSSTLSYSYIQQMANAIAAEHNVKIQIANDWRVDVKNKILSYNPTTMMFGSKGELLSTLLHEVGRIKMCTHVDYLTSQQWFIPEYKKNAYQVLSAFDDFRVDDSMIKSYPSADEVYESQEVTIRKVVSMYDKMSQVYNETTGQILQGMANQVFDLMRNYGASYQDAYKKVFNKDPTHPSVSNESKLRGTINKIAVTKRTNIYDYLAVIVYKGYGLDEASSKFSKEQLELFDKTSAAIGDSIGKTNTQEVLDGMSVSVYPIIEYILKDMSSGSDEMKDAVGEEGAKKVMHTTEKIMGQIDQQRKGHEMDGDKSEGENPQMDKEGNLKSRGSLMGKGDTIPKEWADGDYNAIKDSVQSEINTLTRKLMNLRKKESIIKYEHNHRRGKLNTKILHKHRLGSNRLFKRKMDNVDTVRSFVFSLIIDKSGSMFEGNKGKIIHTTRAVVMLSEVFNKLDMPFEIIYFDTNAKPVKQYDEPYSKNIKKQIAGVISIGDGSGTDLEKGMTASKILTRKEMNRVSVVLTDGEVEDARSFDSEFFIPYAKQNIKSIVIGLECGTLIKQLNKGQGRQIKNSSELPNEFYEMLNSTILKT